MTGPEARAEGQPQEKSFNGMLEKRQKAVNSLLCVGIDPDYSKIPQIFKGNSPEDVGSALRKFGETIVDATHDLVCAYKPNIAFYEEFGDAGLNALVELIEHIREIDPEIPIILDAKRTDIGNTNAPYVRMAFDHMKADAITVNPYFGGEALKPFLDRKDKGVFVLCKTSNPGAAQEQDDRIYLKDLPKEMSDYFVSLDGVVEKIDGQTFIRKYQKVAYEAANEWNKNGNVSLVVGATYPEDLAKVRKIVKDKVKILIPGLGAQGGKPGDLVKGFDSEMGGVVANMSRAIIFPEGFEVGQSYSLAVRKATRESRDAIREKQLHPEGLTPAQEKLADLYITTKIKATIKRRVKLSDETFKIEEVTKEMTPFSFAEEVGEFALKLHEKDPGAPLSPYYINQRELPDEVYRQIGIVLTESDTDGKPDAVTGIPKAGTPIAKAYAEAAGVQYIDIFDKELTENGRRIVGKDGVDNKKLRLRIGDDLVTGADTKFEAIDAAEKMGFEVEEIRVIIDREQGGKEELEKRGYKLKAAFTVSQLLNYYLRTGKITKEKYRESMAYLVASKK
jgi:orotidine-5'-phosphate decarboxylase